MIPIRNIAITGLITCIASYSISSYAATIIVNTTDMTIDVAGSNEFIDQDTSVSPPGRSGLYKPDSITIEDLEDINKNPTDANSGTEPAISLPEAIIAANNTPGADLIVLQANEAPYTLSTAHNYWYGPNALPPITSNISIIGNGLPEGGRPSQSDKAAVIQRDPGAGPMRLFFVMGSTYTNIITEKAQVGLGTLSLVNLHIRNGLAQGGNGSGGGAGLGGAIFNQGLLSISGVTFSNNIAQGGNGSSTAGLGGGGVAGNAVVDFGGGFFNTVFIGNETDVVLRDDTDITLSIFGGNGGENGSGGFGPLDDNGINGGGPATDNSSHTFFGAFGAGGGRAANIPTENGNDGAFGSGGGYGVTGGAGGFGGGGGQSSSASNDSIAGFAGGKGTSASGGGGAGLGGAIFNHNGLLSVLNSTFSENQVIGGNGSSGGSAYGAAIFSANAPSLNGSAGLSITHSTIFNNTCSAGTGIDGVCDSPVYTLGITGSGVQDGIANATANISNSIIANQVDVNYVNLSNNKLGNNSGSTLTLSGTNIVHRDIFNGTDATLNENNIIDEEPFSNAEILDENAGLTPVIIPSSTSPAIDAADNSIIFSAILSGSNTLSLDQLQKPRFKQFIETPGSSGVSEVLGTLPTNLGSVETGQNTAPEIIFSSNDEGEREDNPSVADNSTTPLSALFTIRDLDDSFQQTFFDMQLNLSISDSNGTLNISTELILAAREAGLIFTSSPAFTVIDDTTPETVALSSISLTAPLSTINTVLSSTTFQPTEGLGGDPADASEISISIDDLGNIGDTPSTPLNDNKTLTISIEGVAPAVGVELITNLTSVNTQTIPIRIIFSEQVNDFDINDISISNGAIISELNELSDEIVFALFNTNIFNVYETIIQPDKTGDIRIEIPADIAEDPSGLKNTASNIIVVPFDADKPSISTSGIPSTARVDAFTVRFIFDEDVSGFTIEDIRIENATLSDFEALDARTYSVVISPNQISGVRFSIRENIASDAAGNGNQALTEQVIPLQSSSGGGSGSGSPLFSLIMLILCITHRRIKR